MCVDCAHSKEEITGGQYYLFNIKHEYIRGKNPKYPKP
jgi:hypothetical protein